MANARGSVTVQLLGKERRLRLSLGAADEIETRLGDRHGGGLVAVLENLAVAEGDAAASRRLRFGTVLAVFEELAKAGGNGLSAQERASLMPEDIGVMVDGILEAGIASGMIQQRETTNGEDPEKKMIQEGFPGSPGDASPSAT